MPYEPVRQAMVDDEHLRLLSIGYYVSAGITGVFSLFGLFYAFLGGVMGLMISQSAKTAAANAGTLLSASADQASQVAGLIFGVIGFALFLFFIALAALKFFTGRCLKQRKSRTFCFVVSILTCLEVPYGTVLGACTILVLERPSVKYLFDSNRFSPAATPAISAPNSAAPPQV
jgi:hypothetical protein